jgi:hypothetical protein
VVVPSGNSDTYQVQFDQGLFYPHSVLDNDQNAGWAQVVAGSGPQHGYLVFNSSGTFTYEAYACYIGTDTFLYVAGNWATGGISSPIAVTLLVNNYRPVSAHDEYWVVVGETLVVPSPGVIANDTGADAAELLPWQFPSYGTLNYFNTNGSFSFTGTSLGNSYFGYTPIHSASGAEATSAYVTIHVTDGSPLAYNDSYSVAFGSTLHVAASGVLSNDHYANAAQLLPGWAPSHGSLTLNPDGSFDYSPNPGFDGTDWFEYVSVNTVTGETSFPARVNIHVLDGQPVAVADHLLIPHAYGAHLPLTALLENDHGANAIQLVESSLPPSSNFELHFQGEYGTFHVTGSGSFQYIAIDTVNGLQSQPITVTFEAVLADLAGMPDTYEVSLGGTIEIPASLGVLANDTWATKVRRYMPNQNTGWGPYYGSLELNQDGSFTYTAVDGSAGFADDWFYYIPFDVATGTYGSPVLVNIEVVDPY